MEHEEKKEVVVTEDNKLVIDGASPAAVVQMALSKDLDLDRVEKMLELQEKWEKREAEKAFTKAMTKFKENAPVITKDKENSQYRSHYTTIGNLVNTSLPKMSICGLSHKWEIDQDDNTIKVTCVITHEMGHKERTSFKAPPDTTGQKNAIQQIKSTITYLKSATFESAMGLASTDANCDDDGNGANPAPTYINAEQKGKILDMVAHTGANINGFLKFLKAESIENIPEKLFEHAIQALKAKEKKNDSISS